MKDTIHEISEGLNSGGAAFALLLVLLLFGFLVFRMGRTFWTTVWPTITTTLSGFLSEFKRSNDGVIALQGKLDTVAERASGEHATTRAIVIREIHAAREMTETVIRERASDTKDLVREELSRTGEHAAVTAPEAAPLPPRRAPTNPRMPSAPR